MSYGRGIYLCKSRTFLQDSYILKLLFYKEITTKYLYLYFFFFSSVFVPYFRI